MVYNENNKFTIFEHFKYLRVFVLELHQKTRSIVQKLDLRKNYLF